MPKSRGYISWKGLIQETSPGLNLEKFARVSKNLRKFSLSEWQFIRPTTKQRNDFVRPAETAGFGPWYRDIQKLYVHKTSWSSWDWQVSKILYISQEYHPARETSLYDAPTMDLIPFGTDFWLQIFHHNSLNISKEEHTGIQQAKC